MAEEVNYVYRTWTAILQPTHSQEVKLNELLKLQCELYNAALEERQWAWKWEKRSVSKFDQFKQLADFDHPIMKFGTRPVRGTLLRVDRSMNNFFRRVKAGQKAGFPRYKSKHRWDSIEYPDKWNWKLTFGKYQGTGRLTLKGVGPIRFRGSRKGPPGEMKTLVIKKERSGKWRITVFCKVEAKEPLSKSDKAVGVDVGITVLAATSDSELIDNPRFLKAAQEKITKLSQRAALQQRGSKRQKKTYQRLAKQHRKVANQRRDYAHLISRQLVNTYGIIAMEDLKITNMVRKPKPKSDGESGFLPNGAAAKAGLNREINSAGWGMLRQFITYKAEEAGRELIVVAPHNTSQACFRCGYTAADNRNSTTFRCLSCDYADHADINAARNILRVGLTQRLEREATAEHVAGPWYDDPGCVHYKRYHDGSVWTPYVSNSDGQVSTDNG